MYIYIYTYTYIYISLNIKPFEIILTPIESMENFTILSLEKSMASMAGDTVSSSRDAALFGGSIGGAIWVKQCQSDWLL